MKKTSQKPPGGTMREFKRTKVVATIGPASDSYEAVKSIINNGANALRLNFSHGDHAEHGQRVKWIRKASKELSKPVAIIQDLQGPKIRLGDFDGIINVQAGQSMQFVYKGDYEKDGVVPTQFDLSKKIKRGERLYVFDGKVRFEVTSVKDGTVHARAVNDGVLLKRKGINLPDTDFGGDVITKKDKADLVYGAEVGVDYVAQSFVQTADDIASMKRLIKNAGSNAKVIAKIETRAAVENIEAIALETDAMMVARGDLAIETEPESVPIVQRKIVGLGRAHAKPTIVATQMLASMTEAPEPTRAEVSDVATAVIIGADAVMLSDETANGRYPLESVQIMKRVILYTQANNPVGVSFDMQSDRTEAESAISNAIMSLARDVKATAIVAETKSGATARLISSRRSGTPIIAVTSEQTTMNQLALVYGVQSYHRRAEKYAATKLTNWLLSNKVLQKGDTVVTASGQYPGVVGTTDTIKVRVL